MIKVLVVEDSPVVSEFLVHVLADDPEIEVIGTAGSGKAALRFLERARPDVITMDVNMPGMNGFEATRLIMERYPTPIIIVSGTVDTSEMLTSFRAMEAGALAILPRPAGLDSPDHEPQTKKLTEMVRLMSEVKVVRRWEKSRGDRGVANERGKAPAAAAGSPVRLVAMGASTGGPLACRSILSRLPRDFAAPLVIVQHMARGFVDGFIEWLAQSSGFSVCAATDGAQLQPGHAYVAPDGAHLGVSADGRAFLDRGRPENGMRPSVSFLFRSVAQNVGPQAVGVLLTGMGKDGARELALLRSVGATTVAQNEESSVVYGMPGEAVDLQAAAYVLTPERIADLLAGLVARSPTRAGSER